MGKQRDVPVHRPIGYGKSWHFTLRVLARLTKPRVRGVRGPALRDGLAVTSSPHPVRQYGLAVTGVAVNGTAGRTSLTVKLPYEPNVRDGETAVSVTTGNLTVVGLSPGRARA